MKVATYNINNINRRLPNLLAWLRQAKPDVVALQELKSTDEDFPLSAIEKAGYGAVWRGEELERRRPPGAQRRSGADQDRTARRSRR
jgi:exonuclease III